MQIANNFTSYVLDIERVFASTSSSVSASANNSHKFYIRIGILTRGCCRLNLNIDIRIRTSSDVNILIRIRTL